ncbi:GNAT family N-acetyltransferase [Cytobacillus gottheilii]|uniref:GNAT family N-acetyltransferase n=1 Tax=Cytobacillus gottheilii TaxID=859144 RepID=UPI003CEE3F2A
MNPILFDFPEKIETERLLIRPCLPGDGQIVHEAIQHSLEELKQWLPFAHKQQTLEQTEENIRNAYALFIQRQDIRLHIFRKEDQTFIGATGLHRISWEAGRFEIGYWCDTRWTKRGYLTEAVQGLTAFSFEELHANRVEIRCDTLNTASRKIPERLGFTLEGILRKDSMSADGTQLRDTCVFAKVKE